MDIFRLKFKIFTHEIHIFTVQNVVLFQVYIYKETKPNPPKYAQISKEILYHINQKNRFKNWIKSFMANRVKPTKDETSKMTSEIH